LWYNSKKGVEIMDRKGTKRMTGELAISEDVIAKIAGVAAKDVAGVAKLVSLPTDIRALVRKDRAAKAVSVSSMDSAMTINIAIAAKADVKLTDVCENVQKAVKASVQNMLNRPVAKVNVIVNDIVMPEAEA
jgi:uncharacterized alkaline shock family protein YloU